MHKNTQSKQSVNLRDKISEFLRFNKPQMPTDIKYKDQTECEGYIRQYIEYELSDGDIVEAYMLVPKKPGPHPGVLALHQHHSQWKIGKSEICGIVGDPYQAFGPALAQQGICVLAPDAVGFESRYSSSDGGKELAPQISRSDYSFSDWLQYYNQMCYRLVSGDLLIRKLLGDASAAISILMNYKEVDTSQIGIIGHSFGGIVALFLAALDNRVGYTCSSGAACTYRNKIKNGTGLEMSLVIPNCLGVFDIDDLVKCIAPRKIHLVSSDQDPYTADISEIIKSAQITFEAEYCGHHLSHFEGVGQHDLDQIRFDNIINWICTEAKMHNTTLKGDAQKSRAP